MKRIIEIVVDLKNKMYNTLILKQMDTTVIKVKLLDNNIIADLTSQTVDVIFTKPDNTIVQQLSSNIDKENGIATIPLLEDCVRQHGKAKMEIEVKNTNSEVITSFYIPVQIEKTSKGDVTSENTPNYFEEFAIAIDKFKVESAEMLEEISTAEETRVENEKNRVSAETARVEAETARAAAEETRIENEKSRVTAEDKRIAAETARAEAETARATAEANRVTEFNEMIQNVDVQAVLELRTMLMEAISPITTEDGAYITTEDEEMIICGL